MNVCTNTKLRQILQLLRTHHCKLSDGLEDCHVVRQYMVVDQEL